MIPNVWIQMCSYAKDAEWARYALRSINKYARGFAGISLIVPVGDARFFKNLPARVNFHVYAVKPGKPKLHYLVKQCHADAACPKADFILHMDSDCLFVKPVTPDDYFVGGKPVLLRESFEKIKTYCPPRCKWKLVAEQALGFPVEYETMVRHPSVHYKWLYACLRAHVSAFTHKSFEDYVFSCSETPLGFTEYPTLGAYAMKFYPEKYHWIDAKSPHSSFDMQKADGVDEKMRQFWSHDGVDSVRRELERIVS